MRSTLLIDRRIDNVAAAHDVGLNGFERIVFAGRNLLESGGVHDDGDAGQSALQAAGIAHVADEVAQSWSDRSRKCACHAA